MNSYNSSNWTGRYIRNDLNGHWDPRNHNVVAPETTGDKVKGVVLVVAFSVIIAAMFAFSI